MDEVDKRFAPAETQAVLFHKGCADGFAGAWVAWRALGSERVFYHAVAHGEEPPWDHLVGKKVLIVDFSWPRDVVLRLKEIASGFVLLDHHATAAERLRGVAGCAIDLEESGATLAWKWFAAEGEIMPRALEFVRDRDLWRWELPHGREFSAALYVEVPFDFDAWDARFGNPRTFDVVLAGMVRRGACYRAYEIKLVSGLAKWARALEWRGMPCRVAQVSPRSLASEVGEEILRAHADANVAICWTRDDWNGEHKISLRAREGETDVARVAELFGGGGHAAAAAFSIDLRGRDVAGLFAARPE